MFSPMFHLCSFCRSICSLPYLASSWNDSLSWLSLQLIPYHCFWTVLLWCVLLFICWKLSGFFGYLFLLSSKTWEHFRSFFGYSSLSLFLPLTTIPRHTPPIPGTTVKWIGFQKTAHSVTLVCRCVFTLSPLYFILNSLWCSVFTVCWSSFYFFLGVMFYSVFLWVYNWLVLHEDSHLIFFPLLRLVPLYYGRLDSVSFRIKNFVVCSLFLIIFIFFYNM